MIIRIRVIPKAGENEVVGRVGNVIRVQVVTREVTEEANRVLVQYLAEFFEVRPKMVHVIRGERAREKTIHIVGRSEDELEQMMESIP